MRDTVTARRLARDRLTVERHPRFVSAHEADHLPGFVHVTWLDLVGHPRSVMMLPCLAWAAAATALREDDRARARVEAALVALVTGVQPCDAITDEETAQ
jgi:hypothetical protein